MCVYSICCCLICCPQQTPQEKLTGQHVMNPMRDKPMRKSPLKDTGDDKEDGSVQVHRKPVHEV